MKVAVVGSRGLRVDHLETYLPENTTEIVSGGALGVDTCARAYALQHGLKLTEFLPDYKLYGRGAPLKRNLQIIAHSDMVLAFWDGRSHGTRFVIEECGRRGKAVRILLWKENTPLGQWPSPSSSQTTPNSV